MGRTNGDGAKLSDLSPIAITPLSLAAMSKPGWKSGDLKN